MNAEVRRSSRLANKPELNYKETRDRKPRAEWGEETPTAVQEFPDRVESDSDSDETFIDEIMKDVGHTSKVPEAAEKLFRTVSNPDEPFPECLKGRYQEDPSFKPILDNPDNFTNFEIRNDLIFFRSEGSTRLAVPDVKINGQSVRESVIRQGHSILAHLGGHKTVTYLREQVWWKTMVQDITDYCKSCPTCAASKSPTEKPRGLLKTMPVPTHPWQYIGIDFVGPLPESSNRNGSYDMICVIIDLLTAMVHLVATRQTYRAVDMAEVIFDTVFKLHGLPERIISDRDSLFTSHFWRKLHALLNIELRLSSAFHPQTDGATERANRTMTQMLRQCVSPNQKDWVSKLPAIEFAMNSARSSTTGFTPFYLNYGRNPSPMIWKGEEIYPGVRQFAENMKDAIMSAHDAIIASRVQHTVQANKKRLPASFKEGDLVYLSTKNISLPKGRARKLSPKYLGPFPITKVIKEGATYQLGLSDELIKRGVNRAFHASLLRPHVPSDDRRFPGRLPVQIPGFGKEPEEWIVDRIVTHHGKGLGSEFQIQWKAGDRTWSSYREVAHLNALDRYCELMGVKNASELPSKRMSDEPESEGENIIRVHACALSDKDKSEGRVAMNNSTRSTLFSQFSSTLTTIDMDSFTNDEMRECTEFDLYTRAAADGIPPKANLIQPARWAEYLQVFGKNTSNRIRNYGPRIPINPVPTHQPIYQPHANTVSMPAGALESIIRAIGRASAPQPKPQVVTKYIHRPLPKYNNNHHSHNNNNHRGRGGYNGRGKGKGRGGGHQSNRRGPRSDRTEDPRINRNQIQASGLSVPIYDAVTAAPVNIFDTVTNDSVPINDNAIAGSSTSGLGSFDFLDEFNTESSIIATEDVPMDNETINEEESTV